MGKETGWQQKSHNVIDFTFSNGITWSIDTEGYGWLGIHLERRKG